MVKRIFTFLNKEFHGINEAALLLGGFTFLSQILGLVRDRILAHDVGAGPVLDVYYAAFRIPDFLYVSVASLASITVLMPFLVSKINKSENGDFSGRLEAKRFLNNIFSAYMIFMLVVCVLIFILMPYIAIYITPGFSESQILTLVKVSRIMLLSPIFIGLSNLIGTVTQLFKNFFIFSLSPIFYNLGIIIGVVFLYPIWGVSGMAIGVIIGAVLHFSIQIPTLISHGFLPKLILKINWKEVVDVIKISLPRTITLSVNSLAFMVLIGIASSIKDGSISLFTFSYNLQSVPVGIIGISYSVAAFPVLVKSFSKNNMNDFVNHILFTSKQIIFWSIPVIVMMVVLRAQIVRVILGTNTFSWADTRLTAASISLFVVSLATQSLILLFIRGYYAAGNTKKPLFVNVLSSVLIIVFAFVFINIFKLFPNVLNFIEILLRVNDVPGTMMLSLPLSFALGSIFNFILIWKLFKKDFLKGAHSGIRNTFFQVSFSSILMGIVTYFMLNIFDNIFNTNTGIGIFLQGFFAGLIGLVFLVSNLILFKNKELKNLFTVLSYKFWKKRIIAPEQGEL